jgi:hypothetical protein
MHLYHMNPLPHVWIEIDISASKQAIGGCLDALAPHESTSTDVNWGKYKRIQTSYWVWFLWIDMSPILMDRSDQTLGLVRFMFEAGKMVRSNSSVWVQHVGSDHFSWVSPLSRLFGLGHATGQKSWPKLPTRIGFFQVSRVRSGWLAGVAHE